MTKIYKNSMPLEEKQKIVDFYLAGNSLKQTSLHFGFTPSKILYIVSQFTSRRPKGSAYTRKPVNDDYFEVIDTENKAYWLGFLTADGCITDTDTSKRICMTLQTSDKEHLQKFLNNIESKVKISSHTEDLGPPWKVRNTSNIKVTSNKMAEDLIDKGIIPRKCGHCYPYSVTPELERHYWRGLVDGDGSVLLREINNRGYRGILPSLNLTGDLAICEGFSKFCQRFIPTKTKISKCKNTSYIYTLSYRYAYKILDILYHDANIYLNRKYNTYLQIKEHYSTLDSSSG